MYGTKKEQKQRKINESGNKTSAFEDNRMHAQRQTQLQKASISFGQWSELKPLQKKTSVIQKADWYEFGAANVTPHIHAYSGGDCHLKVAGGDRFDLIKDGRRVKQSRLNEAFDRVREDFPDAKNATRIALLAKMRDLIRGARKHASDE